MSETLNISKMAVRISAVLFDELFWQRVGPREHRWPCENPNHLTASGKGSKTEHPSDVVFWYDDPYSIERIFINVDLKAFKGSTYNATSIGGALSDLRMAVACANISGQWKQDYEAVGTNPRIHGMLFAFNHDGQFTGDFRALCKTGGRATSSTNALEPGQMVVALGPRDIDYLIQVAADIQTLRGQKAIPDSEFCSFYHPDLTRRSSRGRQARAATLQDLVSPLQLFRYADPTFNGRGAGYLIYYRGEGTEKAEYRHILSLILHYQLFRDAQRILVCCPNAHERAVGRFSAALNDLKAAFGGISEIEERLKVVEFRSPNKVHFNITEFLMGYDDV